MYEPWQLFMATAIGGIVARIAPLWPWGFIAWLALIAGWLAFLAREVL